MKIEQFVFSQSVIQVIYLLFTFISLPLCLNPHLHCPILSSQCGLFVFKPDGRTLILILYKLPEKLLLLTVNLILETIPPYWLLWHNFCLVLFLVVNKITQKTDFLGSNSFFLGIFLVYIKFYIVRGFIMTFAHTHIIP